MADQQQNGIAGRFFKAFEQGVGSVDVHRFNRLDQHHLAPAQLRGLHHKADQIPYLVNLDRLVGFFGFQDVVVGMTARSQ